MGIIDTILGKKGVTLTHSQRITLDIEYRRFCILTAAISYPGIKGRKLYSMLEKNGYRCISQDLQLLYNKGFIQVKGWKDKDFQYAIDSDFPIEATKEGMAYYERHKKSAKGLGHTDRLCLDKDYRQFSVLGTVIAHSGARAREIISALQKNGHEHVHEDMQELYQIGHIFVEGFKDASFQKAIEEDFPIKPTQEGITYYNRNKSKYWSVEEDLYDLAA